MLDSIFYIDTELLNFRTEVQRLYSDTVSNDAPIVPLVSDVVNAPRSPPYGTGRKNNNPKKRRRESFDSPEPHYKRKKGRRDQSYDRFDRSFDSPEPHYKRRRSDSPRKNRNSKKKNKRMSEGTVSGNWKKQAAKSNGSKPWRSRR